MTLLQIFCLSVLGCAESQLDLSEYPDPPSADDSAGEATDPEHTQLRPVELSVSIWTPELQESEIYFAFGFCKNTALEWCEHWVEPDETTVTNHIEWQTSPPIHGSTAVRFNAIYYDLRNCLCNGSDEAGVMIPLSEINSTQTNMWIEGDLEVYYNQEPIDPENLYAVSYHWEDEDGPHQGCAIGLTLPSIRRDH